MSAIDGNEIGGGKVEFDLSSTAHNKVGPTKIQLVLFAVIGVSGFLAAAFLVSTIVLWVKLEPVEPPSPEYMRTASKIFEPMNMDTDPCDDFYEYVCGNYADRKLFDADNLQISSVVEKESMSKSIVPRLLNKIIQTKETSCKSELQAAQFYRSCMNEFVDLEKSNSKHVEVVAMNFTDLDTARTVVEFFRRSFTFDLRFSDGYVGRHLMQWPVDSNFLSLFFSLHPKNYYNIKYSMEIKATTNAQLPFLIPGFQAENSSFVVSERGLSYVLNLLFDAAQLEESQRNIFSDRIVQSTIPHLLDIRSAISHSSKKYIRKAGEGFQKWITFFRSFDAFLPSWANTEHAQDFFTEVANTEYMEKLNKSDLLTVPRNSMEVQLISTLHFLLRETNNTYVSLSSSDPVIQSKRTAPLSRELQCLELTSNSYYINGVLANAYMKYYMGEDAFRTFDRLVVAERQTLLDFFDSVQSRETRESLREYISKIEVMPSADQLRCEFSDTFLEGSALTTDTMESYSEQLLRLNDFYRQIHSTKGFVELGSSQFWYNAYYSGLDQRVHFLTFLIDKMYSPENHIPLDYAGMGSIIGHEFSHSMCPGAFNDFNDLYLNSSRYYWDRKTNETYQIFAQCLVDFYNKHNISGKNSLPDNYSDALGLKIAFYAMKNTENMEEIRDRIRKSPILNRFSSEQLFFIYWGQLQCRAYLNEQKFMVRAAIRAHAPPWSRINLIASMFPDFATAFNCKEGDFMTSGQHCKIWP